MTLRLGGLIFLAVLGGGCPRSGSPPSAGQASVQPVAPAPSPPAPAPPRRIVVSVVGTNDLHGRVHALPVLGGHLQILRELRAADGGVLLVDGGDMFQGTLESNLGEGAAVVRAYNALGYHAAAVGNHEFDFGPVGERATPGPGDDPQGALKARAAEARFPFLTANVVDAATGVTPRWANVAASTLVTVGGLKVGVIGASTLDTPFTTIAANFAGLKMVPLAEAIPPQAAALRQRGAQLVVVTAHAGSRCRSFTDPNDLSSCDREDEIFQLAEALPAGTVDAIVGGHSHSGVAHIVNGIPIIEAYSYGRSFGRVDLTVDAASGRVVEVAVKPPRDLCRTKEGPCRPERYEGREVTPDQKIAAVLRPDVERAAKRREEKLGIRVESVVWKKYDEESPLGNLFADLILTAQPGADVAIQNGGGLRAELPVGELTYGQLYEAFPFDNRLARVSMTGAGLRRVFADNLRRSGGTLSIAGARVRATCRGRDLAVELVRPGGRRIADGERVVVATSDFLATGGDGVFGPTVTVEVRDALIREEMATLLRKRRSALRGDDPLLFDPRAPRIENRCPKP